MDNVNIDEDGIRYGVQHARNVDYLYEEAEPFYGDHPTCPECGGMVDEDEDTHFDYYCPRCKEGFVDHHVWPEEALSYVSPSGSDHMYEIGDNGIAMLFKSPYCTTVRPCSICYPNAGDLDSFERDGYLTYCFGPDFFEGGRAPYDIFSIETGALLQLRYTPPLPILVEFEGDNS